MLQRCAVRRSSALQSTKLLRNYFPLGLQKGPKNLDVLAPINNFDPKQINNIPKHRSDHNANKRPGFVMRHEMKLHCEKCRFQWLYDTLTVRCSAHPRVHNQQEIWLNPTWVYERQQPHQWYRYMNLAKNPRTGQLMSRETAKGMNTERRAVGLTTYAMNMAKEGRGISRHVAKIGTFSTRWQTRFPLPT